MIQKITFNPLTGRFDFVNDIPELTSDPATPNVGDTWVIITSFGSAGLAMGPLGLTYSGPINTYQLSYYTAEGVVVRTELS